MQREPLSRHTDRIAGLPKGTTFARYALALLRGRGDLQRAVHAARAWDGETPQVSAMLKAQVAALSGTDMSTGALEYFAVASGEFIELVRPMSILGRLPRVRKVPFDTQTLRNSATISAGWVGEMNPIPASSLSLDRVTLTRSKIGTLLAFTNELVFGMSAETEAAVLNEFVAAVSAFSDRAFIDPAMGQIGLDSPASITFGATTFTCTGTTVDAISGDLGRVMQSAIDQGSSLEFAAWVLHPRSALGLSLLRNTTGAREFPEISVLGGTLLGLPVLTSAAVPISVSGGSIIALVDGNQVLLADDGVAHVEWSHQASVQLVTNPSAGAQPATSLWQNNLVSARVIREIRFEAANGWAAVVLDGLAF